MQRLLVLVAIVLALPVLARAQTAPQRLDDAALAQALAGRRTIPTPTGRGKSPSTTC